MKIKEALKEGRLLCDGAFGTYYASLCPGGNVPEAANLSDPDTVRRIHCDYIRAGAGLIRTNTFAANSETLGCGEKELINNLRAAVRLAADAQEQAGRRVFVAGDIGPCVGPAEEYGLIAETLLEEGADCLVFETFDDYERLLPILHDIKKKRNVFTAVQFCVNQQGYTNAGLSAGRILKELSEAPEIDALGFNCGVGPGHLYRILEKLNLNIPKFLTALPNASYPKVVRGRVVFSENADYFARRLSDIAKLGVDLVGGCCGTTPEYIKMAADAVDFAPVVRKSGTYVKPKKEPVCSRNAFYAGREADGGLLAVELAPPFHADASKIMEAAAYLKRFGADTVTFPDSPSGRTRADSIMTAVKAAQTTDVCVMPHICCRDKNMIAIRAELLGAYLNGVRNLLVVTGDPVPTMMRGDVKSVYNFDSVGLMKVIQEMNEEEFADDPIVYGGALSYNRLNPWVEAERMKKKMAAGASFFLTQPLFTEADVTRLKRLADMSPARILCGIMPLVSRRNALFIQNEMAGIEVGGEIISRYREDMSREEGEAVGVGLAKEIISMTRDFAAGYYFSIPFNRVYLLERILGNEESF